MFVLDMKLKCSKFSPCSDNRRKCERKAGSQKVDENRGVINKRYLKILRLESAAVVTEITIIKTSSVLKPVVI